MTSKAFDKLEAAFNELMIRIDAEQEFPDAVYSTARKHKVNQQALEMMYDDKGSY